MRFINVDGNFHKYFTSRRVWRQASLFLSFDLGKVFYRIQSRGKDAWTLPKRNRLLRISVWVRIEFSQGPPFTSEESGWPFQDYPFLAPRLPTALVDPCVALRPLRIKIRSLSSRVCSCSFSERQSCCWVYDSVWGSCFLFRTIELDFALAYCMFILG